LKRRKRKTTAAQRQEQFPCNIARRQTKDSVVLMIVEIKAIMLIDVFEQSVVSGAT